MELTLSKRSLRIVAVLVLVGIGLFSLASRYDLQALSSRFDKGCGLCADEPAVQAIEVVFSPSVDQAAWQADICSKMTAKGCDLFEALYADALWKLSRTGATASFVRVAEEFEDFSAVWELSVQTDTAAEPLAVYVHVQQEDGRWLLARILFDQEVVKYEQPQ